MRSKDPLLTKYNNLPEWLRWIVFFPISSILSIILWIFLDAAARNIGAYEFVLEILHPVTVQVVFLWLIFYTVPRGKFKWVTILIIIRSLFLLFFIAQPVLNFLGANLQYDWILAKELIGEIVTLIVSISLFRELKKTKQTQL